MKRVLLQWILLFATLLCATPLGAQVRTTIGIAYGPDSAQRFDLVRPPAAACPPAGCPVVLWFHGHNGTRTLASTAFQLQLPTSRGIAVASCDYRVNAGNDADTLSLRDAKRCRRWVSYHAKAWKLDSTRVACWGGSLGGYLCNWLVLTCGDKVTGYGRSNECVRGGAVLVGGSDLTTIAAELATQGCAPIQRSSNAQFSPIRYVGASSPPWFGLSSRDDCFISYRQTVKLDSAYRAVGALSVMRLYDGLGHGGPGWHNDSIVNPQLTFFQLVLR